MDMSDDRDDKNRSRASESYSKPSMARDDIRYELSLLSLREKVAVVALSGVFVSWMLSLIAFDNTRLSDLLLLVTVACMALLVMVIVTTRTKRPSQATAAKPPAAEGSGESVAKRTFDENSVNRGLGHPVWLPVKALFGGWLLFYGFVRVYESASVVGWSITQPSWKFVIGAIAIVYGLSVLYFSVAREAIRLRKGNDKKERDA